MKHIAITIINLNIMYIIITNGNRLKETLIITHTIIKSSTNTNQMISTKTKTIDNSPEITILSIRTELIM
jgi:hypothetical protein